MSRPSHGERVLFVHNGEDHLGVVTDIFEATRELLVVNEWGDIFGPFAWTDVARPVPFEAAPVEDDSTGRHRPEVFQACRQDPEQRARARAKLTEGAERFVQCAACRELWPPEDIDDHPCLAERNVPAMSARGASCTYAAASAQAWGHIGWKWYG